MPALSAAFVATIAGGSRKPQKRDDHDDEREEARNERLERDARMRHAGVHRAGAVELAHYNQVAAREAAKLIRDTTARPSVPATTWVSLGPTDAPRSFNFFEIKGVDSGRPSDIVADPRNGNVVYVSTSGGGVWKTFDFLAPAGPTWIPITDTLPNLAVGALALDAAHPDTVYVGHGDFIDGAGNTVAKSANGGATWSTPVVLDGTYASGVRAAVGAIRDLAVAGDVVWAATDAGLFKSVDAGVSFQLVDLPEPGGVVAESLWTIVPIGGGGWVASGVTACDVGAPAPGPFGQSDPSPTCRLGTNAAVWRTEDGATWTQITNLPQTIDTNRITLAVGPVSGPNATVVYAYVGSLFGDRTVGFWRSLDGGKSWVAMGGALANPTLLDENGDNSCISLDAGQGQSWYNQSLVVDPTNADHVVVGGNLCGLRTRNATAAAPVWENVSHWLPGTQFGETAGGRLPYVHADWQTAGVAVIDGKVRVFAGSDGGVFSSTNVFSEAVPEKVQWRHHNRGLATHLFYSIASGDPATGNPFVLYGGLQDNGTRFRATPANPSAFNQVVGGDGIGGTIHTSQTGTTYWASVQFGWVFCKPAETDCSVEQPEAGPGESHWHDAPSPVGLTPDQVSERANDEARRIGEDAEPFFVHYANVETDKVGDSVLTHTDKQVFVAVAAGSGFTWKSISQDLTPATNGAGIRNVAASRSTPGLYGAVGAVSAEPFYVTTQGNTKVTWTRAQPVFVGTARLTGPSSIDFPPMLDAGQVPGQVFVGAFTGILNNGTVPPDDRGRLWRTTDGGATWTSIVGADPARRLPNVPVYVVKYDPVEAKTIYAGTDLGVYITLDGGATWDRMGEGLPMVPVRDIYVAQNQDFIRVATYGRGLWEIYPSAAAHHGAPGTGDYDRNLQIDWIDLGAMAARQGVTPMQTTAPLYTWILDVAGSGSAPVQAIDNEDLAALIAKFGGHP